MPVTHLMHNWHNQNSNYAIWIYITLLQMVEREIFYIYISIIVFSLSHFSVPNRSPDFQIALFGF